VVASRAANGRASRRQHRSQREGRRSGCELSLAVSSFDVAALTARQGAASVVDSIVADAQGRSASRTRSARGEGWLVLQVLLGPAIIRCGFVGVYWPGSADSFLAILGR
jgi:hypothetical protein